MGFCRVRMSYILDLPMRWVSGLGYFPADSHQWQPAFSLKLGNTIYTVRRKTPSGNSTTKDILLPKSSLELSTTDFWLVGIICAFAG